MFHNQFINNCKPLIICVLGLTLTEINQMLATVSFISGISYTVYRFYNDFKNKNK